MKKVVLTLTLTLTLLGAAGVGIGNPPEVLRIRNVTPPIRFPRAEADVDGDGDVTKADVAMIVNLPESDELFRTFHQRLRAVWPQCPAKAGSATIKTIMRAYVDTARDYSDAVGVALICWDGTPKGALTWTPLDRDTLEGIRTGHIVFVQDEKTQMWMPTNARPATFFGKWPPSKA